jgi:ketosteroid isomerase-like protein
MGEQHEDAVRTIFERFAALDPDPALELFHDEIEWTPPQDEPETGTVRGKAQVMGFILHWMDAFDGFRAEPHDFTVVGEAVVVPVRISGRMKGSGAEVAIEEATVFWFEEDKVREVRSFRTMEEALQAARAR